MLIKKPSLKKVTKNNEIFAGTVPLDTIASYRRRQNRQVKKCVDNAYKVVITLAYTKSEIFIYHHKIIALRGKY